MKAIKKIRRDARRRKIRKTIKGTKTKPRLVVFRSLLHIYAQIIDDSISKTLVSASDLEIKESKITKVLLATKVGEMLAKKAIKKGIKNVVFDRAGYKYHGRVKALADGARKTGLIF